MDKSSTRLNKRKGEVHGVKPRDEVCGRTGPYMEIFHSLLGSIMIHYSHYCCLSRRQIMEPRDTRHELSQIFSETGRAAQAIMSGSPMKMDMRVGHLSSISNIKLVRSVTRGRQKYVRRYFL